jgi:hypothetical protein
MLFTHMRNGALSFSDSSNINITEVSKMAKQKKAMVTESKNSKPLTSTIKRSNFDLVALGVCPHCDAKLGDEVHTTGSGVIRTCEKCQHRWYLNRKIRTTKCQTCASVKRKNVADEASARLDLTNTQCYNTGCDAEVAQVVEQRTENPRVPSSILGLGTINRNGAEVAQR